MNVKRKKLRYKGTTVGIYQSKPSNKVYGYITDRTKQSGYREESLDTYTWEEGLEWLDEQYRDLVNGKKKFGRQKPTLGFVSKLYLSQKSPDKSPTEQLADKRYVQVLLNRFGSGKDLSTLTYAELQDFKKEIKSGKLTAKEYPVPREKRSEVRDGTVGAHLKFLRYMCRWAVLQQVDRVRLLREDPTIGFPIPVEKSPMRPMISHTRLEKLLEVASEVTTTIGGKRKVVSTFLSELLILLDSTGRRINAVLKLKFKDLHLNEGTWGCICWPSDTDKLKRETLVPLTKSGREAIERMMVEHVARGWPDGPDDYLFPRPNSPTKPLRYEMALDWLEQAEKLAGLPKIKWGGFHSFRRKWATERKHATSEKDAATAGGWKSTETFKNVYQQATVQDMQEVVDNPKRLREVENP